MFIASIKPIMHQSDTTSGRLSGKVINQMIYHHKICIGHPYTCIYHCPAQAFGNFCSSSYFHIVGVRLVELSLRCTRTATFVNNSYAPSSSAFLRSIFTQSSRLSCRLLRFLQPSCFFVSDFFDLSSFILSMCPAHFIELCSILSTIQT